MSVALGMEIAMDGAEKDVYWMEEEEEEAEELNLASMKWEEKRLTELKDKGVEGFS